MSLWASAYSGALGVAGAGAGQGGVYKKLGVLDLI